MSQYIPVAAKSGRICLPHVVTAKVEGGFREISKLNFGAILGSPIVFLKGRLADGLESCGEASSTKTRTCLGWLLASNGANRAGCLASSPILTSKNTCNAFKTILVSGS